MTAFFVLSFKTIYIIIISGDKMLDYFLIYLLIISLVTAIVTYYDKKASVKFPRHRVSEAMLFLLALIGGAVAELLVMKKIRHKTKHKRFMMGLPAIIILHIILIILYLFFCF